MNDLGNFSSQVCREVEAFVDSHLDANAAGSKRLVEAMRYSFFSGGKRIRPQLVCAAAEAVRLANDSVDPKSTPFPEIYVASAVEAIHTYSLIHDDLPAMDDDDLRRGKPTCHKAFDEATAILAGDALLNLGFQFLLEGIARWGDPMLRAAQTVGTATGIGGMVTGQMLDLLGEEIEPTLEKVQAIHRNKTGALLHASVLAGGLVAQPTVRQEKALSEFGEAVGLAFQIVDDLLDLEQSTETLGKRAGKDVEQNKMTYPAVVGIERSHEMAGELTRKAEAALEVFGESAARLHALARMILRRDH